jgi:hypothetical protein
MATRDDNSDTGTRQIRVWSWFFTRGWHPYPARTETVWDGYFFPPAGNLTGTWYFTTTIILGCEQVKMYSFCYINYDLFWLLNFATRLSQIFIEY